MNSVPEVDAIEDYIFSMKHKNEQKERRIEKHKGRTKLLTKDLSIALVERVK